MVLGLLVCIPAVRAQGPNQPASPTLEPASPLMPSDNSKGTDSASNARPGVDRTLANTPGLAGAQPPTLGASGEAHNFLLPGFTFFQQLDTNGFGTAKPGELTTLSYLLGSLSLHRNSGRSQFELSYSGGGSIANNQSDLNSVIQQLSVGETIRLRRSTLLFSDQFFYLPESTFGFPGFGISAAAGSSAGVLTNLRPPFAPNQTILTGRETRITNTFLSQIDYQLNPWASITALGSYGILHFSRSGFLNGYNAVFQSGYNYMLTAKDTIAILYRFNAFRFSGSGSAIDDHVMQIVYKRQIKSRLTFRLAGGPDVDTFHLPGMGAGVRVLWSVDSSFGYRFGLTELDLSYLHGLTGGGGVLSGAETHVAQVTLSRNLSRAWRGSARIGYARDEGLAETTPTAVRPTFNTSFGGVELSRPLGRRSALFLAYTAQFQDSNAPVCTALNCGTSQVRHLISVGLNWGAHPIPLE